MRTAPGEGRREGSPKGTTDPPPSPPPQSSVLVQSVFAGVSRMHGRLGLLLVNSLSSPFSSSFFQLTKFLGEGVMGVLLFFLSTTHLNFLAHLHTHALLPISSHQGNGIAPVSIFLFHPDYILLLSSNPSDPCPKCVLHFILCC